MSSEPTTPDGPTPTAELALEPGDEQRACQVCGTAFVYTTAEQAYHAAQGWTTSPSRCPACREQAKRKQVVAEIVQFVGRRIPPTIINLPQLLELKKRTEVLALIDHVRAQAATESADDDPAAGVRRRAEYFVSLLRATLTPEEQDQVVLQPLEVLFAEQPPGRLTVQGVAEQLGEAQAPALQQIRRLLRVLSAEQVQALLEQTEQVEAEGGMWLEQQQRRRTKGGVFFTLARDLLTPEQCARVFPPQQWSRKGKATVTAPPTPPAPTTTDSAATSKPTGSASGAYIPEQGGASVKLTLIGRPGRVIEKAGYILTSMTGKGAPALPKGLPAPPAAPTTYTVYISAKQWRSVAEALHDAEDVLIAEGYPAYDPELEGVAVFVTGLTTKKLQAAKRQQQG